MKVTLRILLRIASLPRTAAGVVGLVAVVAPASARPNEPSVDECLHASDEGQSLRAQRRFAAARASLLVCAQDACPPIVRANCGRWLSEVEASLPTVVLAARSPADAELAGETRVLVD